MPRPIVVGIDPLRGDAAPLHFASSLARRTGAPLVAVASFLHDPISNAVSGGDIDEDLSAQAAAALDRLAGNTGAEMLVAGGSSAAHVLHDVAVQRDAGLLVIGSTRKGRLGRLTPGSTAERLLHGSPCPVAVSTPALDLDWEPRRIGVGFVDLEEGREALNAAVALASAAGSSIRAVSAIEPRLRGDAPAVAPFAADQHGEAQAAAQRALDSALEAVSPSVPATGETSIEFASAALVALSVDVDLLVCGSRSYGPLRAVLLGGVTHRLMHDALCPIVIVPRGTERALEQMLSEHATTVV